jgi:peptidoglycan-associated lipoprotein
MKRSLLMRAALALVVLAMLSALSGCRTTGPKKWWEFWKRPSPRMYPDDTVIPPQPDQAPLAPGQTGQAPAPGSLAEAAPDRTAMPTEAHELQTIYFDYDSSALSEDTKQRLDQNAEWIKTHTGVTVQVEGHCDERGSTEYNLNLGQRRADAVREHLVGRGIDAARLITISYGEERPIDPGHDEAAWSKNRRAQFLVY